MESPTVGYSTAHVADPEAEAQLEGQADERVCDSVLPCSLSLDSALGPEPEKVDTIPATLKETVDDLDMEHVKTNNGRELKPGCIGGIFLCFGRKQNVL